MPLLYKKDNHWPETGAALELGTPMSRQFQAPENYMPSDGLVAAVNTALMLGQPLLLSGEPGTGKTHLAYHVARRLGLPVPLKFEVKSATESRDLFYTVDHIRQFSDYHTARASTELNPGEYVTFQALGLAILRGAEQSSLTAIAPKYRLDPEKELWGEKGATLEFPFRSIVLIDEIDKAPRDVPNDILNEIEYGYFKVPELRTLLNGTSRIQAETECKPIVIFTSNSEKSLPKAFLRRCVYHNIEFPNEDDIKEIIRRQLVDTPIAPPLVNDVVQFVYKRLRVGKDPLTDKPGTAEVLGFLLALHRQGQGQCDTLKECLKAAKAAAGVLAKNESDLVRIDRLLDEYCR